MEIIKSIISFCCDILYRPYVVPLLLLATGIYFTIRSKFMQGALFRDACKMMFEKPEDKKSISSFGALMVSTASRVGTGNIIGVSTAICLGGAGAIFWMWITAILGGVTAFVESTLAQIYKRKNPDGSSRGGPSFYMEQALGQRWLGILFSVIIILIYAVGYNLLASYNLQSTFGVFSFYNEKSSPVVIGLILMVLFGVIVIGGARRLVKVTEVLVPVMGIIYVLMALIVMVIHIAKIPAMFAAIFSSAFDFKSIFGGFSGSCIMWGIKRGLYSNEAGMGSAPNAAAKAEISHPAKQGLVQMISVFIDTLLICTASAFMFLLSDVTPNADISGAQYVQQSMKAVLGSFGPVFLSIAMSLFAFTTLIGNYSYCEGCLEFILKRGAKKSELLAMRIFATIIVFVGAIASASLVWDFSDMLQGIAVLANIPTILILGNKAVKCLEDYVRQKKEGKDPVFKAKDIGIEENLDYWN